MTRNHTVAASVLVLILGACKASSEPAAGVPAQAGTAGPTGQPAGATPDEAKSPNEAKSGETPAEATPPAEPKSPAQAEPTAPAAADAGPAATGATLEPSSLVGQVGFDWLDPDRAKCRKLDTRMAKKLAGRGARCRRRPAGESFDGQAGEWASCRAGKVEWLLFADQRICQEQLETMQANAP